MYIIAGLGNPTKQYENTRHNIGFMAIDALADKYDINMIECKHKSLIGKGMIKWHKSNSCETAHLYESEW